MSEDNNNSDGVTDPKVSKPEETQAEYVRRTAYEEVTKDMHKFKKEREEYKAAMNELQSQLKAQEESKMHEKEQWKELYEKREAELELERQNALNQSNKFTNTVKRAALKHELGGKIKEEYLSFAGLGDITVSEEGIVDPESLRNVANEFRKQHGQLIPNEDTAEITGHASTVKEVSATVNTSGKTAKELVELYAKNKLTN
jgi:hypothetical protein